MSTESNKPLASSDQAPNPPEVPWTQPNGISAAYDLHCHCGAVRLSMNISPPLYEEDTQGKEQCVAVECDCSHCERHGFWAVHPLQKDVEWTRGLEHRGEYLMGSKKCPHYFCKLCGSVLATDLTFLMENVFKMENRYSINIRMLKNFDRKKLKVRRLEVMANMPPKYTIDD
ncbi:Hypothetical protein R9X50_00138800 [Acrodontium crateriforme]|uniref:CENP-V/GFA domain-containing protein n=1 Tax=Acrodontium crateriforme TaxID=150365 RepID=A0AAQ3R2T0_9PEZI|nr:Hypothetical protein R9X50_00138800 [Acrodontium crateriforme]